MRVSVCVCPRARARVVGVGVGVRGCVCVGVYASVCAAKCKLAYRGAYAGELRLQFRVFVLELRHLWVGGQVGR